MNKYLDKAQKMGIVVTHIWSYFKVSLIKSPPSQSMLKIAKEDYRYSYFLNPTFHKNHVGKWQQIQL